MTLGPETQFGPYSFVLARPVVDNYCAVTGLSDTPIPASLVFRVLTEPAIVADLRAAFGPRVPVHVSQAVTIVNGIAADHEYTMTLQTNFIRPGLLRLSGTLRNAAHVVAANLVSEFVLMDDPDVSPA